METKKEKIFVIATSNKCLETIANLKRNIATAAVPVLLILKQYDKTLIGKAIEAGIDDYILQEQIDTQEGALEARMQLAIQRSKRDIDRNPLTKLPGNLLISKKLETCDSRQAIIYLDIDNFKQYNDMHGFEEGDQIIQKTAQLLTQILLKYGGKDDFLGHIGGDDFVIVTKHLHSLKLIKIIRERYKTDIPELSLSIVSVSVHTSGQTNLSQLIMQKMRDEKAQHILTGNKF